VTRVAVLAYIQERAAKPFAWGTADCVQFAGGMIERVTGTRPPLPSYESEIEAGRLLAELGGLEAAVSSVLGPVQSDLRLCRDGDIVLTFLQGKFGLGIATPRWFWVLGLRGGVLPFHINHAKGYWPCRDS